jgi:hypothetical protein
VTGLDIEDVRARRDTYRDAFARVLRASEPDSDRADDRAAAQDACFSAAVAAASDVSGLVDEVERLRAEHDRLVVALRNARDGVQT